MFDGRFRSSVDKGVGPIGSALGRTGLSPDHLTALGLVMAVPAAVAIGTGRLTLGLILLILSAVPDLLDGALAKASGTASRRGAFFDSVSDRVTDAVIMGGVAWYLQTSRHGHVALLPYGILAVSTLISYQRAKAESLGFDAKGGLMERAERIILLCIGLVAPVILVPILWVMLILTAATAVQRFAKVWRQATVAIETERIEPAEAEAEAEAEGAVPIGPQTGVPDPGVRVRGQAGPAPLHPVAGRPADTGQIHGSTGAGDPDGGAADSSAAMAERWRAWRQQSAARQGGSGMASSPRPGGIAHESDGPRRSTRWEERRAARLRPDSDPKRGSGASGRRHGTRRP